MIVQKMSDGSYRVKQRDDDKDIMSFRKTVNPALYSLKKNMGFIKNIPEGSKIHGKYAKAMFPQENNPSIFLGEDKIKLLKLVEQAEKAYKGYIQEISKIKIPENKKNYNLVREGAISEAKNILNKFTKSKNYLR